MRKSDEAIKESEAALGRWLCNHPWNPYADVDLRQYKRKLCHQPVEDGILVYGALPWLCNRDDCKPCASKQSESSVKRFGRVPLPKP